jgi:hypothetical protein
MIAQRAEFRSQKSKTEFRSQKSEFRTGGDGRQEYEEYKGYEEYGECGKTRSKNKTGDLWLNGEHGTARDTP